MKIEVGRARTISSRELARETSKVLAELCEDGRPAVITRHGKFIAVLAPVDSEKFEQAALQALSDELPDLSEIETAPAGDTLSLADYKAKQAGPRSSETSTPEEFFASEYSKMLGYLKAMGLSFSELSEELPARHAAAGNDAPGSSRASAASTRPVATPSQLADISISEEAVRALVELKDIRPQLVETIRSLRVPADSSDPDEGYWSPDASATYYYRRCITPQQRLLIDSEDRDLDESTDPWVKAAEYVIVYRAMSASERMQGKSGLLVMAVLPVSSLLGMTDT